MGFSRTWAYLLSAVHVPVPGDPELGQNCVVHGVVRRVVSQYAERLGGGRKGV